MTEMKLVISADENGIYSEKYIPLSQAEMTQRAIDAAAFEEARLAREAEDAAKAEAKAALVARALESGFTEEEIAALTAQ